MNDKPIRLIIIEDDPILLDTYQQLIRKADGIDVLAGFVSFESADKNLADLQPDVIMLDVELQGISGIEAIPLIRNKMPNVNILILTVFESEKEIFKALGNGASGYLTKDCSAERIIESIRDVHEGGGPMSRKIARIVVKSFEKNNESPLSRRETEILKLVAEGKKRNEICEQLFIERDTVKSHMRNIYTKLQVNSRAEAIRVARDNRLI
ncbi:MAG: response regulator [Mucilaginibacter sp.]|nr:response regulator [Mucilaginibacter sp.]